MNYTIKIYRNGDENGIENPTESDAVNPLSSDMTDKGYAYTLLKKEDNGELHPIGCGGFFVLKETEEFILYAAWVRISSICTPWKIILRLIHSGLKQFAKLCGDSRRTVELVAFVEENETRFKFAERFGFEKTDDVYEQNGKIYRKFFYRN